LTKREYKFILGARVKNEGSAIAEIVEGRKWADGDLTISIDYQKYDNDRKWDGIKGYITNTDLSNDLVVTRYRDLWQIERAFRISKTDLQIRPVYHRRRDRIEFHKCISFMAYLMYKELERLLMGK
jgi:transposase